MEQEMAAFKGFSTNNGEVMTPDKPEDLNPVAGKTLSVEEKAAADKVAAAKLATDKTALKAVPVKLTDAETEAAVAAAETAAGHELTDEEVAAAVAAATAKKNPQAAKPKKTLQDRINAATRKQRTAERERDALAARVAALEAGGKPAPLTTPEKGSKDDPDTSPDPTKFEYGEMDSGYIRALARFETRQEIAANQKKQNETQLTAKEQEAAEKFATQKAAFEEAGSEKYDDFADVVMDNTFSKTNPSGWPLSDVLGAMLLDSEQGPDIAYMLASDIKLAKEVFGKSPARQAAWFGVEEAKRSAGSGATEDKPDAAAEAAKPGTKVVSKAPTPITRARGQGSNSSVPGSTTDFAAFEAVAMGRRTK
jgi:hypothetical protein